MPKASATTPTAAHVSTVNVGIDDAEVPDVTLYMKDVAKVAISTPLGNPHEPKCVWGAPVCFWGLPAVAKSDKIKQAAAECNLAAGVIMPGQRQPEDFAGVLVPDARSESGVRSECLIRAISYLNYYKKGVLFIDEVSTATPATQGSMLGMVNDRQVGDVAMEPGIRILLAANPPKYSAGGWKLEPPMANRMCHVQVKCPPVDEWIQWLTSEGTSTKVDVSVTEALVQERWASSYSKAKGLLVGFMHGNRTMLHMEPLPETEQSSYCWASPRTWWLAGRVRATAELLGMQDKVRDLLVEGCIGKGAYELWMTWERQNNLPTPEEALAGTWTPDVRRPDVCVAVLTSTTQFVINTRDRNEAVERATQAWTLFGKFLRAQMGDLVITAAKTLVNKNLSRSDDTRIKPAAEPVIQWMIDKKVIQYAAV